jgi:hypothetical protein
MASGHLITDEEFELLEAAKRLPDRFGIFHGNLVTARGTESAAQGLLLEVVTLAWAVKNAGDR